MTELELKLSSKQKGEISENRIAEIITLASAGRLSCFRPISDDDGLDLIVSPKGKFQPLFIQIKSRFKLQKNRFIGNVGSGTFVHNKIFYLIFMLFNEATLEVDAIWLIPSQNFQKLAYRKKGGKTYKEFYRFNANPVPNKKDRWQPYLIDKSLLASRIEDAITQVYSSSAITENV